MPKRVSRAFTCPISWWHPIILLGVGEGALLRVVAALQAADRSFQLLDHRRQAVAASGFTVDVVQGALGAPWGEEPLPWNLPRPDYSPLCTTTAPGSSALL